MFLRFFLVAVVLVVFYRFSGSFIVPFIMFLLVFLVTFFISDSLKGFSCILGLSKSWFAKETDRFLYGNDFLV